MPLSFQNLYSQTAYVALLWFDPGCSPDRWRKIGWFAVDPNQTVQVVGDDLQTLKTPYFGWFADTGADGPCWSGDHWYRVPHNAGFDQCYDDDTGCNAVWPFIAGALDTDWWGFTIMLLSPGKPDQASQGCAWGSVQEPPPIKIAGFAAHPVRIHPGDSSTLSWQVFSYGVAGAKVTLNGAGVPFTGSENVSPSSHGDYTLRATTPFSSDSKTVSVWVGR